MTDNTNERRRSDSADGPATPGRPSTPEEHLDAEVLAGYLDSASDLPQAERATIEAHLAACGACRATLAQLRAVVMSMSALPEIEAPRSFALTPELAEVRARPALTAVPARDAREPIPLRQTAAWQQRQARMLRWATAAAAVLFVFVLSVDIVSTRFMNAEVDDTPENVSIMAGMAEDSGGEDPPQAPAPAAQEPDPSTESLRATSGEPQATPAGASHPYGADSQDVAGSDDAANSESDGEADDFGDEEPSALEDTAFMTQDATQEGESSDTMIAEEQAEQQDEDRRSMSSSRHYWRLAQVGLAMLFVWLLAAMIVLPRRASTGSGRR